MTRLAGALLSSLALVVVGGSQAAAQEDPIGEVEVSFEVGDFDADVDDWVIDAVEVTGGLAPGQPVTVEVRDGADRVIWSETVTYQPPSIRVDVTGTVAVGDVASAGVAQPQVEVAGVQVQRPEVSWSTAGGGGSGQLALSMVLAVIIVAIVFRTPTPSASTQRWTR